MLHIKYICDHGEDGYNIRNTLHVAKLRTEHTVMQIKNTKRVLAL